MTKKQSYYAGDWVEVLIKTEILRTLDKSGQLEGMPFMPEMFAYSGRRFQVVKRAHKTCDTVFPIRGRKLADAVHLETRCDGSAHGGCQASCLIFWKDAWVKRVDGPARHDEILRKSSAAGDDSSASGQGCTEQDVFAGTLLKTQDNAADPTYVCQNTQVPYATTALPWWDLRQYVEDYFSGNVGMWRIVCGSIYSSYYYLSQAGIGLGRPMRWFYDRFHWVWGGTLWPRAAGPIPLGQSTPHQSLDLEPGELVRVKPFEEILKTLNVHWKNRGMYWDAEMVPYCGKSYRVLKRVTKIIDEKTGKMIEMKNPCLILDSVVCESRYSYCRMFCPRAFYSYWRETWLERVSEPRSK